MDKPTDLLREITELRALIQGQVQATDWRGQWERGLLETAIVLRQMLLREQARQHL